MQVKGLECAIFNAYQLHQDSKTCVVYLQLAKSYADQLAAIGQLVADENLISYVMMV
jgi:hypothetical protein